MDPGRPDPHFSSLSRVRVRKVKNYESENGSGSRMEKFLDFETGPGLGLKNFRIFAKNI